MQKTLVGALAAVLSFGAATAASAQSAAPATDRVFVNVNFGMQPKARTDARHFGFGLFLETGAVDVARKIPGGSFLDVTGGVKLFGNLGLAVNFMQRKADNDGTVIATLPDPFFYDEPIELTAEVSALKHRETWVAALVSYDLPMKMMGLEVTLLAGPAVATVEHEVVTDIAVDPVTQQVTANLAVLKRGLLGFQAGADVRWMLMRNVGIGGYVRFNAANGNLGETKAELGGLQFGAGVRVRF